MRVVRSNVRASSAKSPSLIAVVNGTSNSVRALCAGGPDVTAGVPVGSTGAAGPRSAEPFGMGWCFGVVGVAAMLIGDLL